MTGMRAAALADDTTGALEIGALFAAAGVRSRVFLDPDAVASEEDVAAAVIDTGTRHVAPDEAAKVIAGCGRRLCHEGVSAFFKKTDSTLRGNIASEMAALLEVLPGSPLVYVPAYPKLGRTVVNGVLLVDGVPVAETAFGRDSRYPVRESSVVGMLRQARGLVVKHAPAPESLRETLGAASMVVVCDAGTDEDLDRIASVLAGFRGETLVAGPGGFAPYWMRNLGLPRSEDWPRPRASSGLIICGSRHPRSREQVARALATGLPLVPRIAPWTVTATAEGPDGPEDAVASRMAERVRHRLQEHPVDALVVFGGDTAHAILRELQVASVEPVGELRPGIPASRIHHGGRRMILVTKAGGFGSLEVVEEIVNLLRG